MTRRVLVTGAAGGIGGQVVADLVSHGWRVAALDRAEAPGPAGPALVRLSADLTSREEVAAAVAELARAWDGLDALVNCAAIGPPRARLEEQTAAGFTDLLDVNVVGQQRVIEAVWELLLRGSEPAIVNVSSIGAARAFRGNPFYCAGKGAIEALTRALALDMAEYGVRVNAVAPGMVSTPAWSAVPPAELRRRGRLVPLGRPAAPAEVAAAIRFLAGTESSYVTGAVLPVDGGLSVQAYPRDVEPGVDVLGQDPGS